MTGRSDRRLDPDELLRRVQAEERRERRGRLKIFLGYAPRVGKSFRMFDEGRRRKERGQDVVIAAAQSEVAGPVREIVSQLEIIPATDGAMDVLGVLRRHPQVCLIDQLSFNNPPGSRHPERWQDVEEVLNHGIAVITAINVQYIREQQAAVEGFTGKRALSSVPERFLHEADEIEVVDAPPDVTMGDPRVLAELRELALLLAADVVDRQLQEYLDSQGVSVNWGAQERILVCLTPRSNARAMLESGQRNAERFHGALLAAYVEQPELDAADRARLDEHLVLAREAGAEVHCLKGGDFAATLLAFAREQRITQLFLGHSQRDRSPVEKLIDAAEDFDVRLFPHPGDVMKHAGTLKVYLGYAAGVGKTYRMLDEAQTLRAQGVDVVVGYFETHKRKETMAKAEGLEMVPRRTITYANSSFEEMDTEAVLRRKPAVAVVDEFAHSNVPGSKNTKRWQDVHELLDAGIDVLTNMNVQHLESLNDQVWHVTGVRVRETVPDWVVDEADEVVLVDLTPRALRNRIERGVVYAPEKARLALDNFFAEGNLTALRELAIRHTAHEVEEKLAAPPRDERILICLTGSPSSANLIRRGKRMADYLQADCLAVHVGPSQEVGDTVERHMNFARNLCIQTHVVEGEDVSRTIADFARAHHVTQIFMGRSGPRPWWKKFGETIVQQVVRQSRDIQITIVAQRRR